MLETLATLYLLIETEAHMSCLNPIAAQELKRRLEAGDAVLIGCHGFGRARGEVAVFDCRSGMGTQAHAAPLLARGFRKTYFLEGGIEVWKAVGFGVHENRKAPLDQTGAPA